MQRQGRTYENKATKEIRSEFSRINPRCARSAQRFFAGQWFRFLDSKGPGFAQPDLYIHLGEKIILFEFKLSRTPTAERQLKALYAPLLFEFYHVPLVLISAFHNPGQAFDGSGPRNLREILKQDLWTLSEFHFPL